MDVGDFSPLGFGGVSPGPNHGRTINQTHVADDFFYSPSSVTSTKRKRVAALCESLNVDTASVHEHYSSSKRGCMTAAGPEDGAAFFGNHGSAVLYKAADDAVADDDASGHELHSSSSKHGCMTAAGPKNCSVLEHITVPPAEKVDTAIISLATHQAWINQTCAKIVKTCKKKLNTTVMVDCLTPLTDGSQVVVGSKLHNRYESADAAELIQAVDAMNDRVRNHAMYASIWDEVLAKRPTIQRNAMEIHDVIMAEVSDEERRRAGKAVKDLLFASKSSAAKTENRSTYHKIYFCKDAMNMSGTVVHALGIIYDNGQPCGTCTNSAV